MKYNRRDFLLITGLSIASASVVKNDKSQKKDTFLGKSMPEADESWIELNADHIKWNLKKVRNKVKSPVMGVIKANAYGHGLIEFGKQLDQMGINALMVCKIQEAVRLREAGVSCPVYNFGPIIPENTNILVQYNINQFLHSGDYQKMSQRAEKLGVPINVHIHVDTGMNRMGIPYKKCLSVIKKASLLKGLSLSGISTTLCEDKQFDRVQVKRLQSVYEQAVNSGIRLCSRHAASSAGIFKSKSFHMDMVRPGIALYGYYPNQKTRQEDSLSLCPVLEFKSKVVDVKTLYPGDSVSYHQAYKANKKEKIAIIPVGYSDGYPYSVSGKAKVLIRGKKYPIINCITANHMEALLSIESDVLPGDEVTLIGSQGNETITADHIAHWAGISNYKVLIGLNPYIPRYTY